MYAKSNMMCIVAIFPMISNNVKSLCPPQKKKLKGKLYGI